MKKILILNTTFENGGAASIAQSIYHDAGKIFDKNIYFAFGRGKPKNEKQLFYFGNRIETLLHVFLVRFLGLEGYGSYFATRKLINFIKKEKFDIVHIHNLHGYYLNFFTLLQWLHDNKIKIIWTIHDEWPFTWLPAHSMGCVHCLGGEGKCTNLYKYPMNFLPLFRSLMIAKKREIFSYDNITFVSPAVWLLEKLSKAKEGIKAELILHGIDLKIFRPIDKVLLRRKYNLPLDKKLILFSAADLKNTNKGVGYVLGVAPLLSEDFMLLSAGAGLMSNDKIVSFGRIFDKNTLAEIYALSDLYFLSSLAESVSLTMLESLACGVPVIAFDMPATNFVENKNCGLIIKNRDNVSILKTINEIFSDSGEYQQMSLNARLFAENNSNYDIMIKKYLELYK